MLTKHWTHKSLLIAVLAVLCLTRAAVAQTNDMWSALAEKTGAFSPHVNNCDSTEVYVPIAGGILGFCIEKNERGTATWESAKETCASIGKRLPEPAEFSWACKNPPTGLTGMTGNWEFVSNHPLWFDDSSGTNAMISVGIMGLSGCNNGSWAKVASYVGGGFDDTYYYHCVR